MTMYNVTCNSITSVFQVLQLWRVCCRCSAGLQQLWAFQWGHLWGGDGGTLHAALLWEPLGRVLLQQGEIRTLQHSHQWGNEWLLVFSTNPARGVTTRTVRFRLLCVFPSCVAISGVFPLPPTFFHLPWACLKAHNWSDLNFIPKHPHMSSCVSPRSAPFHKSQGWSRLFVQSPPWGKDFPHGSPIFIAFFYLGNCILDLLSIP